MLHDSGTNIAVATVLVCVVIVVVVTSLMTALLQRLVPLEIDSFFLFILYAGIGSR